MCCRRPRVAVLGEYAWRIWRRPPRFLAEITTRARIARCPPSCVCASGPSICSGQHCPAGSSRNACSGRDECFLRVVRRLVITSCAAFGDRMDLMGVGSCGGGSCLDIRDFVITHKEGGGARSGHHVQLATLENLGIRRGHAAARCTARMVRSQRQAVVLTQALMGNRRALSAQIIGASGRK
jgi:hypothetical protein